MVELKVLDENTDYIIGKPYLLCKVNLGVLREHLLCLFREHDISQFNSDYSSRPREPIKTVSREEYDEYVEDSIGGPASFKEFQERRVKYRLDRYESRRESLFNEESKSQFIYDTATENNFISLYSEKPLVHDDKISFSGRVYLLDGYRRLFYDFNYLDRNLDKDVYVKVYDKRTTDPDMMSLMFHFNLWKIPQGVSVWFDRGWSFFIYLRTGLKISYGLLREYLNPRGYGYLSLHKILTNPVFYRDLKLMDDLRNRENYVEDGHRDQHFNNDLLNYLGRKRLDGVEKPLCEEHYRHYLHLHPNEVNKIRSFTSTKYFDYIRALAGGYIKVWMDAGAHQRMLAKNPGDIKVKIVPAEDYVAGFPEEVRRKHNLRGSTDRVSFKDVYFNYRNKKLYLDMGGTAQNTNTRLYLVFQDKMLVKHKNHYIIFPLTQDIHIRRDLKDKIIHSGSLESCKQKIREYTGRDFKLDRTKTQIW